MSKEAPKLASMRPGRAIQALRVERGMTRQDLAEGAGTSDLHVGRIEREQNVPTLVTLERIAEALEVPVSGPIQRAEAVAELPRGRTRH